MDGQRPPDRHRHNSLFIGQLEEHMPDFEYGDGPPSFEEFCQYIAFMSERLGKAVPDEATLRAAWDERTSP